MISLISTDGETFVRPVYQVLQCDTVRGIIEGTDEEQVFCPGIHTTELARICTWCEMYPNTPDDPEAADQLSDWELTFFGNLDLEETKQLFAAANYLGCAVMTRHCALALTNFIITRNPEEVRNLFGLEIIEDKETLDSIAQLLQLDSST